MNRLSLIGYDAMRWRARSCAIWIALGVALIVYYLFVDTSTRTVHPASVVRLSTFYFTLFAFVLALPYGTPFIIAIFALFASVESLGSQYSLLRDETDILLLQRVIEIGPALVGLVINDTLLAWKLFRRRERPEQARG